jgi:hypothetical protein
MQGHAAIIYIIIYNALCHGMQGLKKGKGARRLADSNLLLFHPSI